MMRGDDDGHGMDFVDGCFIARPFVLFHCSAICRRLLLYLLVDALLVEGTDDFALALNVP